MPTAKFTQPPTNRSWSVGDYFLLDDMIYLVAEGTSPYKRFVVNISTGRLLPWIPARAQLLTNGIITIDCRE